MGIRLEWEIESEQQLVRQKTGEDPVTRRQRRRRRFRLLLIPLVLFAIIAIIVGFVVWRLNEVEQQIETVLRDTVDAEIATLRIGDAQAFLDYQRSATETWLNAQRATFDAYQALKLENQIQLTGQILNVAVDDNRARVQVEEIINNTPYVRTWFYWQYGDGWRHVPPDYTFWGDAETLNAAQLTIRYQTVDAALAEAMQAKITGWLEFGCASLGCTNLSPLQVEIIPEVTLTTGWSVADPEVLHVRSPYVDLARLDQPLDFALQFDLANLVAQRLVQAATNDLQPVYPADVYYLQSAIVSWLVGRFAAIDTNSFLIDSLAQNYGNALVGDLARLLQPDSQIDLLSALVGPLDEADLDWRDYLTWRLSLEDELIIRSDEGNFLTLYATGDDFVQQLAYQRYNAGPSGLNRVVATVQAETPIEGPFQLRAITDVDGQQEAIVFRLVNGRWLRAN